MEPGSGESIPHGVQAIVGNVVVDGLCEGQKSVCQRSVGQDFESGKYGLTFGDQSVEPGLIDHVFFRLAAILNEQDAVIFHSPELLAQPAAQLAGGHPFDIDSLPGGTLGCKCTFHRSNCTIDWLTYAISDLRDLRA
jgi:hypothetical protein